jgi:hypothetical protein
MQNNINEFSNIKGRQIAEIFDMSCKRAIAIEHQIENLIKTKHTPANRDAYYQMTAELRRLFKVREYVVDNIIVTAGRSVVAQRLANVTTYTGIINYGALGSSATVPVNANTQMTVEVFRKVVASASYSANVAFIDFYYSKADTNGTYQEFGSFIDGTASANTGQMFTHALTGGWTKSASESMTVSCVYTLS